MFYHWIYFVIFLSFGLQPPAKHWEAVAYNERTGEFAVFSGAEFEHDNIFTTDSLWLFNKRWQYFDDNSISGRWAHALIWHQNKLYTYGGLTFNSSREEVVLNDLYVFDKTWMKIATGPALNRPTLFSKGEQLILAGQSSINGKVFEIWKYDQGQMKNTFSVDIGVEPHGFEIFLKNNEVIVTYFSADGWVIKNLHSRKTVIQKDQHLLNKAATAYAPAIKTFFIFGGIRPDNTYSADVYQITGKHSKKLKCTGPSPRAGARLVGTSNGFILYGGVSDKGKPNAEMWRFQNDLWQRIVYP